MKKRDKSISPGIPVSAMTAAMILPNYVLGGNGQKVPSDKLNIAGVGVGGMGKVYLENVDSENIVALCDVDDDYASKVYEIYPNAKRYQDFRIMLEKQKDIDAVVIGTPDHTHAVIAMMAFKMGKHVYCAKPLTRTIYETNKLVEAAREAKVATQVSTQSQALEDPRLLCEWLWDGAIGPVREVHIWSNRPIWPQGLERPQEIPSVPPTLNWPLWLGPAPYRPYHPVYLPFKWRGWWDFGTGALGDMGCHGFDPIYRALKLGQPTSVQASSTKVFPETAPIASIVSYEFPAREDLPPVKLTWYDGGLMPPRPVELEDGRRIGEEGGGTIFVGDKGKIICSGWGTSPRIIPEKKMQEYQQPPQTIPRSVGHYQEWIDACKGGKPAKCNFDVSGPITEVVLLGNIAIRTGKKLYWDGVNKKITNDEVANKYIQEPYCPGWSL